MRYEDAQTSAMGHAHGAKLIANPEFFPVAAVPTADLIRHWELQILVSLEAIKDRRLSHSA